MKANQAVLAVHTMCRVLNVSRSGFYAWRVRAPSRHAMDDAVLSQRIGLIHAESDEIYGSASIHAELREHGVHAGRKRVATGLQRQKYAQHRPSSAGAGS